MGFYAGIGSRKTPLDVLHLMERIAAQLATDGWVLRSGHAPGADQAFERGADGQAEIFLPWAGFESDTPVLGEIYTPPTELAYIEAARIHPAWDRCSRGARALHARNMHQILGPNLDDPVSFVACWSPGRGGTEQALRLAYERDINVTNLYDDDARAQIEEWLS